MKLKNAEKEFRLTTDDYAKLAAFRYALRGFLRFSEGAAAAAGLSAQHYQAMLILRACPENRRVAISDLARQLYIKHNSAVGLVDRLAQERLVVRVPSTADRRKVELRLTPRGRQVLSKLAAMHSRELSRLGPILRRFFAHLPGPRESARTEFAAAHSMPRSNFAQTAVARRRPARARPAQAR